MDDQPNLRQFAEELSSFSDEAAAAPAASAKGALAPVGKVVEIAGSGSRIRMDWAMLTSLQSHADPAVAMSGQVGSQVKMIVGNNWLIANVRTLCEGGDGEVIANVDFLGEGTRQASGVMANFRRGVTRYPIPGSPVMPVTTEDLGAVFAADDSPNIEIGKSGFERFVALAARRHALLYGLVSVLLSLGLGWAAAAAFKRRF